MRQRRGADWHAVEAVSCSIHNPRLAGHGAELARQLEGGELRPPPRRSVRARSDPLRLP